MPPPPHPPARRGWGWGWGWGWGGAGAALALVLYLVFFHVWIEYSTHPSFDVEAFMRENCFPRTAPLRPAARGRTWCVARRGGRVVGCAGVSEQEDHFLLHHDCVHPEYRRRGVGKRLHRARLALCRAVDAAKPVRLYILEDNAPAHGLIRTFPAFRRITACDQSAAVCYQAPGHGC